MRAAVGARIVEVPPAAVRPLHAIGFRLHAVASEPGWLDLAALSPLIASGRARDVLGWMPQRSSVAALEELARGLRSRVEGGTPALAGDPQ